MQVKARDSSQYSVIEDGWPEHTTINLKGSPLAADFKRGKVSLVYTHGSLKKDNGIGWVNN